MKWTGQILFKSLIEKNAELVAINTIGKTDNRGKSAQRNQGQNDHNNNDFKNERSKNKKSL